MACALFLSFILRGGSVGDVVSGLLSFSACEVMAFPANQEFALSFGVRVGKRDGAGYCSGLVLSGVSSRVFSSVYWGNGVQRNWLSLAAFWWWSRFASWGR
ncbi:TPA: hypothetical protein MIX73_21795 [Klebsiella pneumoniae]|nr:hypothetical protein [Klebsiella pneumoniae]HBY5409948.1 hypothetical protein [Klebsiella pneumoniae]